MALYEACVNTEYGVFLVGFQPVVRLDATCDRGYQRRVKGRRVRQATVKWGWAWAD